MGPARVALTVASTTLLFSTFSAAMPWHGPAPTLMGQMDVRGISPLPTQAPELIPRALGLDQGLYASALEKRELLVNTCAYLSGVTAYTCPEYYTCATDRYSALGCCPLGNAACSLAHTCYASYEADQCDTECVISQNAVVCNDSVARFCRTVINDAGPSLGTLTILDCDSTPALINAVLYTDGAPTTSSSGGDPFSDILATLSSELSALSITIPTSYDPSAYSSFIESLERSASIPNILQTSADPDATALPGGTGGGSTNSTGETGDVTSDGSSSGGSSGGGKKKTNVGAIAGGVVGGVVGLALIVGAIVAVIIMRRKKKSRKGYDAAATNPPPSSGGPGPAPGQYQPEQQQYQQPYQPQPNPNGPYADSTYNAVGGGYAQSEKNQTFVDAQQQPLMNREGFASHEADSTQINPNAPSELFAPQSTQQNSSHSPTVSTLTPSMQGTMSPNNTINSNELPADVQLGASGPVNKEGRPVYEMGDGLPGNR